MKNIRIRRLLTFVLAAVLILCSVLPAAAASASAVDMRLEAVEGTVTLSNASGRTMSVREGMKLYSGYTVATDAKSYAYLTLDSEKAVKLDANSSLEVRKQGKKLELLLHTGELLFDVKSPLKDGETMNIRTSTMVTGIRGTIGIVTVRGDESRLTLLEGSAVVSRPDGSQAVEVTAGTTGIATRQNITVAQASADAIPGFAAVEFAENPAMTARAEAATGWNLTPVISAARELLRRDEERDAAESGGSLPVEQEYIEREKGLSEETVRAIENRMHNIISSALPTDSTPPSVTPTPPTTPTPPAPVTSVTLTGTVTAEQLQTALDTYETVTLAADADATINAAETVTVDAGKTLILAEEQGSEQYIRGRMVNEGTLINNGTLQSHGDFTNNGTITNNAVMSETGYGGSFRNNGTFNNTGSFSTAVSSLNQQENAGIINNSGTFTGEYVNEAGGTFSVSSGGVLTLTDVFHNDGSLIIEDGGLLSVDGGDAYDSATDSYRGIGYLINSSGATITIKAGGQLDVRAYSSQNKGTFGINNSGTITVQQSGELNNYGDIYNGNGDGALEKGTIENYGTFLNGSADGGNGYLRNCAGNTVLNNGTFTNAAGCIVENTGIFTNNGTFEGTGTFTDNGGTLDGTTPIIPTP